TLAGATALAAVVSIATGLLVAHPHGPASPVPTPSAPGRPAQTQPSPVQPTGPTVWYSVQARTSQSLWRRRLDGRSAAILVATRPSATDGGDQFIVGPDAAHILHLEPRDSGRWTVPGVNGATGATSWS